MSEKGKSGEGIKIVAENRKAFHNYAIEERTEAGIVLKGTEVKSLRNGKANLQDSYAIIKNGEMFLLNAHIPPYALGNRENHDPLRTRKLLLHKNEIHKLWSKSDIKGYSVIPLKIYFKKGRAKVELGVGRGKKLHDKRESTKEREAHRQMDRLKRQLR